VFFFFFFFTEFMKFILNKIGTILKYI